MTTLTNTIEAITEHLENLTPDELVNIHNQYCQNANYDSDEIYENDEEFFNMFFEGKVLDAVRAVSYGEYNYSNDYVKFNGYGNLESFNKYGLQTHIDISAIAEDILESPENYDIDLEEAEEETED